jgi:hypothetical protein
VASIEFTESPPPGFQDSISVNEGCFLENCKKRMACPIGRAFFVYMLASDDLISKWHILNRR